MSDTPPTQASLVEDHRLFAAADVLLEALQSEQGRRAIIRLCVFDRGSGGRPPSHGFTLTELTEAMSMLMRLGLIEPRHRHQ